MSPTVHFTGAWLIWCLPNQPMTLAQERWGNTRCPLPYTSQNSLKSQRGEWPLLLLTPVLIGKQSCSIISHPQHPLFHQKAITLSSLARWVGGALMLPLHRWVPKWYTIIGLLRNNALASNPEAVLAQWMLNPFPAFSLYERMLGPAEEANVAPVLQSPWCWSLPQLNKRYPPDYTRTKEMTPESNSEKTHHLFCFHNIGELLLNTVDSNLKHQANNPEKVPWCSTIAIKKFPS